MVLNEWNAAKHWNAWKPLLLRQLERSEALERISYCCLSARPGVLHNLGESRVIEAHDLIDHGGDLSNVGFVGGFTDVPYWILKVSW